jgi:5-methylcytosine-specific restriction endonuclease McrA
MRQLPKRPKLPPLLEKRLTEETLDITRSSTPKEDAEKIYDNARAAVWFRPIIEALGRLSGTGQRCMYCSGSESSDVEHYRPKSAFPEHAMTWKNYLWICTPCNRVKSNQFPIAADDSAILINPLDENVWRYFYIDEFGNLSPTWDVQRDDYCLRGEETGRIIGLDRQALQEARRSRMDDLKEKVGDTIALVEAGSLTLSAAKRRVINWRKQPFQPDVADYFLNGPGRKERPFCTLFSLVQKKIRQQRKSRRI